MPVRPSGRKGPLPSGSTSPPGPTFIAHLAKSTWPIELRKKTTRQSSASTVTTTVTRNESSTPTMFSHTKIA